MSKIFVTLPIALAFSAGLLLAAAPSSRAEEVAPTLVSVTPSQTQDAAQSAETPASPRDLCPIGMAGFGWG